MMTARADGKGWIWPASIVAILFGLLTIREGAAVLFWSDAARHAAGRYVPFVVWFIAMSLRSAVWIVIAVTAYRFLRRTRRRASL